VKPFFQFLAFFGREVLGVLHAFADQKGFSVIRNATDANDKWAENRPSPRLINTYQHPISSEF
jgi:hypothetical protein